MLIDENIYARRHTYACMYINIKCITEVTNSIQMHIYLYLHTHIVFVHIYVGMLCTFVYMHYICLNNYESMCIFIYLSMCLVTYSYINASLYK